SLRAESAAARSEPHATANADRDIGRPLRDVCGELRAGDLRDAPPDGLPVRRPAPQGQGPGAVRAVHSGCLCSGDGAALEIQTRDARRAGRAPELAGAGDHAALVLPDGRLPERAARAAAEEQCAAAPSPG